MKFVNLDHSPYATRVRILLRKKRLPIDIVAPPIALKTPEFLAAHPLGKIPLLELENGDYLPESIAIMEYLEDLYPKNTFRPIEPVQAAKSRVLASFTDTHLGPALLPFFKAILMPEFTFDQVQQQEIVESTLARLDRWIKNNVHLEGRVITIGDMVLAPTFWWVEVTMSLFGIKRVMQGLDNLAAWWEWINNDSDVAFALEEMNIAFAAFQNAK